MENIQDGTFEYLGTDDTGELQDWNRNWDYTDRLPEAVAVRLEMPGESRLKWPDLVAVKRMEGQGLGGRGAGLQQHIQQLINQRRNARRQQNEN